MLFDSYQHFRDTPGYNKIIGENFLIVEFKCPIKEEMFQSWSECHCIAYVLNGKKKWISPEEEWLVRGGESIFVQKGAFLNQQYFEEDFCVLMFFMKDDFIRSAVKSDLERGNAKPRMLQHTKPIYRIDVTDSLTGLYNSFFGYLRQESSVPPKIIELKFREMLVNILTNPSNAALSEFIFMLVDFEETPIARVMEEQFYYNLSMEEFARLCGRSLSAFKREFQEIFDTTPGRWLTLKRVEHAKSLLVSSRKSVQEICYESGFENPSHFNRVFKENYGLTPLQYRKGEKVTSIAGN